MTEAPVTEKSSTEPPSILRVRRVKPTTDTPFHIDFAWWQEKERDWQVYLHSLLCAEHQQSLASLESGQKIDWVDENTAEVREVDGIQHALLSHCARQPEFITPQTSLVEGVFRLFLANGNQPMSAQELADRLGRPANTILTTLAGPRVYKGLRPV